MTLVLLKSRKDFICSGYTKNFKETGANQNENIPTSYFPDDTNSFISSQGISRIEAGLNNFYKNPANFEIPISDAYQHVTLELNYASPPELANNLSNLRRKY